MLYVLGVLCTCYVCVQVCRLDVRRQVCGTTGWLVGWLVCVACYGTPFIVIISFITGKISLRKERFFTGLVSQLLLVVVCWPRWRVHLSDSKHTMDTPGFPLFFIKRVHSVSIACLLCVCLRFEVEDRSLLVPLVVVVVVVVIVIRSFVRSFVRSFLPSTL